METGDWARDPDGLYSHSLGGVITVARLGELGVPSRTCYRRCLPGRPWRRLLPGVVLLGAGEPTYRQIIDAALLYAGQDAVVTGAAACRRRGGENDKSSRKSIPRHKRRVNRENRHRDQRMLTSARGPVDVERAATAEEDLLKVRPRRWRKWPDSPLGEHVRGKLDQVDLGRSFEAATLSPLSDGELGGLLSAATHFLSPKDAAVLHFLSHTGIRVTELVALDLRDVSIASVTVRGERRRTIPLRSELRPSLEAYLRVRAEWPGADEATAYFLRASGCRVSPGSVNGVVGGFGILIGLPELSARTLRKTFAVNLLRDGVDLETVSGLLGHASPDATRAYLATGR